MRARPCRRRSSTVPFTTRAPRAAVLAVAATAAMAALTACSGERAAGPPPFVAYDFSVTDASADTLAHGAASAYPSLDVTAISGSVTASSVVIRLTFTQPVAPWSAQSAGSVDGFVDFDVDENSATGIPGAASEYGGSAPLGADYYLSLRDVSAGHVTLRMAASASASFQPVPATWSGSTLEITIPRSMLPDQDGQFRLSAVVGNADLPATDFAPSDGYYTIHR